MWQMHFNTLVYIEKENNMPLLRKEYPGRPDCINRTLENHEKNLSLLTHQITELFKYINKLENENHLLSNNKVESNSDLSSLVSIELEKIKEMIDSGEYVLGSMDEEIKTKVLYPLESCKPVITDKGDRKITFNLIRNSYP